MKNAKRLKLLNVILVIVYCAIIATVFLGNTVTVHASTKADSTVYCDEYYSDETYDGSGEKVPAYYDVYYDSYEVVANVAHVSAPSFGNGDTTKPNACGPLAGMNIVGFYDRWCTDLIPNYTPGMTFANGTYHYYPDLGFTETVNAFASIYNLMKVGELGGTTSANFRSGLNTYVENQGYSLSYTSMYTNSTSVNLQTLATAISQNKVGLVMCSEYNYISSITDVASESKITVAKNNSTIGHMMMVYGYQTYKYYKNGVNFRTDTFLYVCSSYGSGDVGYMLLDDFLVIDEAYIMTIS